MKQLGDFFDRTGASTGDEADLNHVLGRDGVSCAKGTMAGKIALTIPVTCGKKFLVQPLKLFAPSQIFSASS